MLWIEFCMHFKYILNFSVILSIVACVVLSVHFSTVAILHFECFYTFLFLSPSLSFSVGCAIGYWPITLKLWRVCVSSKFVCWDELSCNCLRICDESHAKNWCFIRFSSGVFQNALCLPVWLHKITNANDNKNCSHLFYSMRKRKNRK